MKINKTKLFENDEVIVNFLENNSTNIFIDGVINPKNESEIKINTKIINPIYRVINKKTTNNLLSEFIPYLDNQNLDFNIKY